MASAGVGYARLESRVPVRKLLPGTLILLLIAVIGLRVALLFQPATWPAVLLAGFGELAALDPEPRTATIVAGDSEVHLLRLEREELFDLMTEEI